MTVKLYTRWPIQSYACIDRHIDIPFYQPGFRPASWNGISHALEGHWY